MKLLRLTALALALTATGQASAAIVFQDNWGFNPDGTGLGAAIMPIDELTYLGISYTESTGFATGDTFQDVGRIGATGFQNDGTPIPAGVSGVGVDYELTAAFLDWTGTYGATTANNTLFSFDPGGTLDIYIDDILNNGTFAGATDGINIMSLSILTGSGNINFGNPGGVDGNINILFSVDSVAQGYWFLDTDLDGLADTDVFDLLGNGAITVGLTDSNNNITTPSAAVAADFVAFTGLGIPNGAGDIYTLNDGSFQPGVFIPEPGALSLLGLGLLGLGRMRRKA